MAGAILLDRSSIFVDVLAAGATAIASQHLSSATEDAYGALRGYLRTNYRQISIELLERDPASQSLREALIDDLSAIGAGQDAELKDLVRTLAEALELQSGVGKLEARNFEGGVAGTNWSVGGDIVIRGIRTEGRISIDGINEGAGIEPAEPWPEPGKRRNDE